MKEQVKENLIYDKLIDYIYRDNSFVNSFIHQANSHKRLCNLEGEQLKKELEIFKKHKAPSILKKLPNVFIIDDQMKMTEDFISDMPTAGRTLNLPFDTVFIEGLIGSLGVISLEDKLQYVMTIMIKEFSPSDYAFILTTATDMNQTATYGWNAYLSFHTKYKNVFNYIEKVLEYINSKSNICGQASVNIRIKSKEAGKNKIKKIKKIVIVKNKKNKMTSFGGSEIDWSHRWEVRGHWRSIRGVGKDRNGDYKISGLTWVKDFVKGPEDKIFVKKTRIVNNS